LILTTISLATPSTQRRPDREAEFYKYFSEFSPQVPDVSTILTPLAPTTRVPLAHTSAYDRHPLVLFLELSTLRVDTERHASRMRALFEQLDFMWAWNKGATCETIGGARGASVLHVHFAGWPALAVHGTLGEAVAGYAYTLTY
jgi:hypothetical protein